MKVIQNILVLVPAPILFAAGVLLGASWGLVRLYAMLHEMGLGR